MRNFSKIRRISAVIIFAEKAFHGLTIILWQWLLKILRKTHLKYNSEESPPHTSSSYPCYRWFLYFLIDCILLHIPLPHWFHGSLGALFLSSSWRYLLEVLYTDLDVQIILNWNVKHSTHIYNRRPHILRMRGVTLNFHAKQLWCYNYEWNRIWK